MTRPGSLRRLQCADRARHGGSRSGQCRASDSILAVTSGGKPIRVANGESIVTADATSKYWPMIKAMNAGQMPRFAIGGAASDPTEMKHGIQIAVLLALAGCSVIPGTEAHQEKLARTALQSILADPTSAQFADLRGPGAVGVDRLLCGRVNAKNSFGAYTGFQRFVANTREGGVIVERNGPDAGFDHLWQDCENRA